MIAASLRDICFSYPGSDLPVLDGVSFDIHKGEKIALIGPNGCGKSTAAKIINALLVPTQGVCLVGGYDTSDASKIYEIRSAAGLVFQDPDDQIIGTTVEEDVAFGLENLSIPRNEMEDMITQSLVRTGLIDKRHESAAALSGGQKQRLALASVIAMRPSIIILDEAMSMIDPAGRADLSSLIDGLADDGIAIVNITHSTDVIKGCSRMIEMDRGKVVYDGPIDLSRANDDPIETLRRELVEMGLVGDEIDADPIGLARAICH